MSSNGKITDPFCRKDFWLSQLRIKDKKELEFCIVEFETFSRNIEQEYRFVMTKSRADVCQEALEELLNEKNRESRNTDQRDLFED